MGDSDPGRVRAGLRRVAHNDRQFSPRWERRERPPVDVIRPDCPEDGLIWLVVSSHEDFAFLRWALSSVRAASTMCGAVIPDASMSSSPVPEPGSSRTASDVTSMYRCPACARALQYRRGDPTSDGGPIPRPPTKHRKTCERHLRGSVGSDLHAGTGPAKRDVRLRDRCHPEEVVGPGEERGVRRGERDVASGAEPDPGGHQLLLGDEHLEVPLRVDLRISRRRSNC